VQPSINQSLTRAVERTVGVIVGVLLASGAVLLLGDVSWLLIALIVAAVVLGWLLRITPGGANQIAISAMLVLALGASTPDYALERVIETAIGALAGLVVNLLVVPPVLAAPAHVAVARLDRDLAQAVERMASALEEWRDRAWIDGMLAEARALRATRDTASARLAAADESLRLNPRARRARELARVDRALFDRLDPIVTQVTGMTRAVHDAYTPEFLAEPAVGAIAAELRRVSHDLRLLVASVETADAADASGTRTSEPPALTAPLVIRPPGPAHWVPIGALLEDLRRLRAGVLGASADE
jgi:uncharacterized membrane protein YgaE (UPF0421/DUF939 family)